MPERYPRARTSPGGALARLLLSMQLGSPVATFEIALAAPVAAPFATWRGAPPARVWRKRISPARTGRRPACRGPRDGRMSEWEGGAVVNPENHMQATPETRETKQRPGSVRVLEMHSARNNAQIIDAHAHNVTGMELSAAPELRLTVNGHPAAGDQGLGIGSARGSAGKLE
jgi:hypothetical protein